MEKDKSIPSPAKPLSKEELSFKVKEFPTKYGASVVGITTRETLAGGPPSANISYVLKSARSAVTFAVPLDEDKTCNYLGKIDREGHQKDYTRAGVIATGIAAQLASFVEQFGHKAVAVMSNLVFRNDKPGELNHRYPDISHRYLAVRGGLGWFGFSGNVLTPDHGPNVVFASIVTDAELDPTNPLPQEDNYCDDCQVCNASCPSGFFRNGRKDQVTIALGGIGFTYTKRRSYDRCSYVCSGHTGLHQSGRWSTWSPARFPIPKEDEDLAQHRSEASEAWLERPEPPGGGLQSPITYGKTKRDIPLTCGNCMHVCHPDKEERKRRMKLLQNGGVIIQHEDGSLQSVSPEEAKEHIAAMNPERRALYETRHPEALDPEHYFVLKHHSQYDKSKRVGSDLSKS
ncbi:MAG: epoxyqueuosine reductase [Halieaceae bacterium]|nr:epoxyqueuosine reductase [Halieaceae bacterium]